MFIATQRLRLLAELEPPERYLKPEYFRAGRGPSGGGARPDQGQGEADQGRWIDVEREALAAGKVPGPDGAMVDLRRLVVTTDAGIGKTTTLQWLEWQWNSQSSDRAAMLLTFGDLRAVTLERVIPDLLCERLLVGQSATDGEKNDARRVLEHLRDEGRLDLLVDGLDQSPPDGAAVALLAQLLASPQWRRCRIVVGGRPHALQRHWSALFAPTTAPAKAPIPAPWRFLSVDEFDEDEQRRYLGETTSGESRFDLLPGEAREILSTPRVLEYLRSVPDAKLRTIKTTGDVYGRAIDHLLVRGLLNSEPARTIGLAAGEKPGDKVAARTKRQAWCLLAAIAAEMSLEERVLRDAPDASERRTPNFDGVPQGAFPAFQQRLVARLAAVGAAIDEKLLDRDLDGLAALNSFVSQGFFDTAVDGLQEVFWRNRSLQEFFTAAWFAMYCRPEDVARLDRWLYLNYRPDSAEFYWVWRFLVEMPAERRDPEAWTRSVEPIYRPGDGTPTGTRRSSEFIYRAWPTLESLAKTCDAAHQLRTRFWGEFEQQILSGARGDAARATAQAFVDSFIEIPAGEFQMGTPVEKQGMSEEDRKAWREFLDQPGDPAARAAREVARRNYSPGRQGNAEWQADVAWWTRVFHDRDLTSIERDKFAMDETPLESWLKISGFRMAKFPTSNDWYQMFDPGHGDGDRPDSAHVRLFSPHRHAPVACVTWYDAWAFSTWARWKGAGCRLPEEDEWEFACKAGTRWDWNYWWGDVYVAVHCNANSKVGYALPPDPARANPWGLVDMLGNVFEWTATWYRRAFDRNSLELGTSRVLRGSSWESYAEWCRSALRNSERPSYSSNLVGFRVARAL